jgi:type IV fimbrial biogenesis protein FimT
MNQKGFSLLELNICCAIMAIMISVAYPFLGEMRQSAHFRHELRELYGNLQYAKTEAIKQNSFVVFKVFAEGYTVFIDDGANGGIREDWEKQTGEQLLVNHRYSNDIQMISTTFVGNHGRFKPRPGIKGGTVILSNANGTQSAIILNMVGRIRINRI